MQEEYKTLIYLFIFFSSCFHSTSPYTPQLSLNIYYILQFYQATSQRSPFQTFSPWRTQVIFYLQNVFLDCNFKYKFCSTVLFFFFRGTPIIHMMALLCLSPISTTFSLTLFTCFFISLTFSTMFSCLYSMVHIILSFKSNLVCISKKNKVYHFILFLS